MISQNSHFLPRLHFVGVREDTVVENPRVNTTFVFLNDGKLKKKISAKDKSKERSKDNRSHEVKL